MAKNLPALSVEIGSVVFRSWEHEWQTEEKEATSIASARRIMPNDITQPIYELLDRWEGHFLRSSLPFAPYRLRVRLANDDWMNFADGNFWLIEKTRHCLPVREFCPNWDEVLPQPRTKRTKYGAALTAPTGESRLDWIYEVKWQPVLFDSQWQVDIDKLLGKFSRGKSQIPFVSFC